MATAIQDLDFVALRDCELAWTRDTLSPPIRAGERVRYFGRGEGRGWELTVGAGCEERALIMQCWDSDIGKQLATLCDARPTAIPESFPDRVLRVAHDAGYEPTGTTMRGDGVCVLKFTDGNAVSFYYFEDDSDHLHRLHAYVNPDNQPEAVRARKAADHEPMQLAPFDGLAEARAKKAGADTLHGVRLTPFPSLAAARAMVDGVINDAERDGIIVGGRDTRTAPVALKTQPGDVAAHSSNPSDVDVQRKQKEDAERLRLFARHSMVSAVIARQVAAGGVDTEGARAEAERWCAMLAGCVCEGMRATTRTSAYRFVGRDYKCGIVASKGKRPTFTLQMLNKPLGRP